MVKFISIEPMPKPRMTISDRKRRGKEPRPVVAKWNAYKQEMLWKLKADGTLQTIQEDLLESGVLSAVFFMPLPQSWPAKKKLTMVTNPHQQTPDLDNLLKGLQDILLENDAMIWKYKKCSKIWSYTPGIQLTVFD